MNSELKKLIERFELEIWLYLDGSLTESEQNFWDKKLSEYRELHDFYDETISALEQYDSSSDITITNSEVDRLLESLEKKNNFSFTNSITTFIDSFFSNKFVPAKAAALAVLSVLALILLLTSEKPNAVKNISDDILSWRGTSITNDLNQMDKSIQTLSMEEWEKYRYFEATHDDWEESFYLINNEIEKMKQDIEDTTL